MAEEWPKPPECLGNRDDAVLLQLSSGSAEIRAGLEKQLQRAIKITGTEERKSPLQSGCDCSPSWGSELLDLSGSGATGRC